MVQMGRIYNGSMQTLVAAQGLDANPGFLGCYDSVLDTEYVFENVEGTEESVIIVTAQPVYDDMMDRPFWNTRGWTFQEKLLSRHCLILAAKQAYFQCKSEVWCEDVQMEL
jgi:hypothetical protein